MNEMNNSLPQDELKDFPKLKSLQGKNPYCVPENYFETLTGRIEQKLENKPAVVKRISLSRMASRFAAAASVVLFLGIAGWFYFHKTESMQQEFILTTDQIANSVYFDDLDLTMLKEEAASATELTATDELESYLLEHDLTFLFE